VNFASPSSAASPPSASRHSDGLPAHFHDLRHYLAAVVARRILYEPIIELIAMITANQNASEQMTDLLDHCANVAEEFPSLADCGHRSDHPPRVDAVRAHTICVIAPSPFALRRNDRTFDRKNRTRLL